MPRIRPLTLRQANDLVARLHRHHKPATGHRFSIGLESDEGELVGAAIVGRPVAPKTDQYLVAEVTRLVTDGSRNACSALYGAAARAAKAMGFARIQTFTLPSESGASLRGAGWVCEGETGSPVRGWSSRAGRDVAQPQGSKLRWAKSLADEGETGGTRA